MTTPLAALASQITTLMRDNAELTNEVVRLRTQVRILESKLDQLRDLQDILNEVNAG